MRGRGIRVARPRAERLERRSLLAAPAPQLVPSDVQTLLDRAARATANDSAIVAVVDREGNLLGLRVEAGVSPVITSDPSKLVFAADGALAEARTGAFFANDQAPLTARTIQEISQSTMTQREIQSSPDIADPNSPLYGPGFVAPIGAKGHFPPGVMFTPQVDLFQIEHTNRDSILHTGPDNNRFNAAGDINLAALGSERFNIPLIDVPAGQQIPAPESYGLISGLLPLAQSRGIGTLPGGVPIYKDGHLVGGIGVFFPGTTGYATEENSSLSNNGFFDPTKPDLSYEAEYIAFVAAGGSKGANASFNTTAINAKLGLEPLPPGFDLPFGRIDLVGITLDVFGPHGLQGPGSLLSFGSRLGLGNAQSGANYPIVMGSLPPVPASTDLTILSNGYLGQGQSVPEGWLVTPHDAPDGSGLTAADVTQMIKNGIAEANTVRAAIRLPLDSTAKMVFAVTDKSGDVLGLYHMPDATYFSIDVAVAKARNVAYYANPAELQPIDQVAGIPAGVAITNRTVRYLAEPRFPEGIDGNPPGPFSILNEQGIQTVGIPKAASTFQTVQGYDSFNPTTNFHDPFNIANQNGIVFFPGSAPVYNDLQGNGNKSLVGGLGVSGDGVDQDDDVTYIAAAGFNPPTVLRADQYSVRGARLPYQKFNRQPHVPPSQKPLRAEHFKHLPLPRAARGHRGGS
jgi:uncharacterized protein GlcG (DUF336 family)